MKDKSIKEKCSKCGFNRFYSYWYNQSEFYDPQHFLKCARCGAVDSNES